MAFYVYILQSEMDGTFYKGSSQDPIRRLKEHNDGLSLYTSTRRPWRLMYVEELPSMKEMLIREKKLKRGNKEYFEKLFKSSKNILHRFLFLHEK